MPNKVSIKLLVEYEEISYPDGDELREQFQLLKDHITKSPFLGKLSGKMIPSAFDDATVTCLSIERDGERVID